MSGWGITLSLMRERSRRHFCLPRFTPKDWWECDVFEVTTAGYFREYEVKISRADFKADAKKEAKKWHCIAGQWTSAGRVKHQQIGQPVGPTRFWYVTPAGLVKPEEVPSWAGLIEMRDRGAGHRPEHRWTENEVKAAPSLHRQKIDPKITAAAESACYYRLHREYCRTARRKCEGPISDRKMNHETEQNNEQNSESIPSTESPVV